MRVLLVGIGSMGRRRLRNLAVLGESDVVAFDPVEARREQAAREHGVEVVGELTPELLAGVDAMIISTPPQWHDPYIALAIENRIPAFIEASVLSEGLPDLAAAASDAGVLLCPSCTMRFHPAIRVIADLVRSSRLGRVTTWTYYMGQYLPDWHPWEDIRSFYVGMRDTSATREMVPFELTWLLDIVGRPSRVAGLLGSTIDMGVDIDDTYLVALSGDGWMGALTVDVVARHALRQLVMNLERGQIRWRWDTGVVEVFDADTGEWEHVEVADDTVAAEGYNPNITERMYIDEMAAYLAAVRGEQAFPNTMADDIAVLAVRDRIESIGREGAGES